MREYDQPCITIGSVPGQSRSLAGCESIGNSILWTASRGERLQIYDHGGV